MEEAAVEYARNRIPVFSLWPLRGGVCTCLCDRRCVKAKRHVCGVRCASPGKHPCTPNGFKDATANEPAVRALWRRWPDAGIGVPTGKASGWLALDRDDRHGGDASLAALIEQCGPLPDTLEAVTGGGGAHYVFDYHALPADVEIKNSTGHLGVGLDIRGAGGYIVVAPTLHASGRRYGWANALNPALAPAWLVERLLTKDPTPVNQDYTPHARRPVFGAVFPEGQRNNGLFRVACGIWGKGAAEFQAAREVFEL